MNKNIMRKTTLALLLAAFAATPVTLASCGDDDDQPTPVVPPSGQANDLTMDRVTGTWARVHSRGTETENGRLEESWDKNVEHDKDCFVFYPDGRVVLMDYDDDQRRWHPDGEARFGIEAGKATFQNGTLRDVRIVSCTDTEMVIVYTVFDDGNPNDVKQYTDKLRKTSQRTDVLDTYNPSQWTENDYWDDNAASATGLTQEDVVGTWQITHSMGKTIAEGKVTDKWNKDVTRENDHFVFHADGRVVLMEPNDNPTLFHADGEAKYTIQNGQAVFTDGTICAMRILSCTPTEMKIHYIEYEDRARLVADCHTETLRLVSRSTSFLPTSK